MSLFLMFSGYPGVMEPQEKFCLSNTAIKH